MTGGVQVSPRAGPPGAGRDRPCGSASTDGIRRYGTSLELEEYLGESTASVDVNVELPAGQWRAVDPDPGLAPPAALLFVDGVRRIEARVWIDDDVPGGGPATRGERGPVRVVRGRRGVLLRPAGPRGAGRDSPRAVHRRAARQRHQHLGRGLHRLPHHGERGHAAAGNALPGAAAPPGRGRGENSGRGPGRHARARPAAGRRPAGRRRTAARTPAPAARPRLHQVAPHHATCRRTSTRWWARWHPGSAPPCS